MKITWRRNDRYGRRFGNGEKLTWYRIDRIRCIYENAENYSVQNRQFWENFGDFMKKQNLTWRRNDRYGSIYVSVKTQLGAERTKSGAF